MSKDFHMLSEGIVTLEKSLGLARGALAGILLEESSDWSFIVKSHALLEATTNSLLAARLGDPRLAPIVESFSIGGKAGKLAIAEALELVPPTVIKFVKQFSMLRNRVIHRVQGINFTFSDHVAGMNEGEKNAFVQWVCCGESTDVDVEGVNMSRRDYVLKHSRLALGAALLLILLIFDAHRRVNAKKSSAPSQ